MSTILKALRRLEEDKQASSPVALEEAIVAPRPARAAGAGPPWVGVLLVGVGLSLLFAAGFYAWPRGGSEPELASVPSLPTAPLETRDPRQTRDPRSTTRLRSQITRPTQPPTSAPTPPLVAETRISTPPLVAETRTPAPPPEPEVARIERTPPASGRNAPSPAPRAPAPVTPPPRAVAAVRPEPEPAAAPPPREKAPPVVRETPAPPAVATAVPEPVATIHRAPVPDFQIRRTVWHPRPDRRSALVEIEGGDELVRLRQGDALGPLVVLEIEPSAVTFQHDGIELRRKVGSAR